MILTLLSMLGGGLMRLLPEILSFLNKKTDNAHELAMMDKQAELERTRSVMRREEIETQGQVDFNIAELNALGEALKGQMQPTGIGWVDALNFLVRPLTTYFFLAMYAAAKIAMFMVAMRSGLDGWSTILKIYDDEDRAILSGILAFWFLGRVFDKARS